MFEIREHVFAPEVNIASAMPSPTAITAPGQGLVQCLEGRCCTVHR